MNKPPNILLVVTDQQHPDLVGAFGRIPVRTPVLDQLCRDGTAFVRAYTACPLCTPSRATLLSGQYPSRHGAWSIGTNTPENALSLPRLLAQGAGYRTALIGKSHLQSNLTPGSFEALPRSRDWDFFRRWTGPYYGFDYAKIHVGHGHEPHAYCLHYGQFLHDRGIPPERPYFAAAEEKNTIYGDIGRWALPEEFHTSTWVADETIAYLRDHAQRHSDRPFFLSVNFPDPHLPFLVPEPWDQMYDGVSLHRPKRRLDEKERNGTTLYAATVERRQPALGWHENVNMPCQESTGIAAATDRTPLEEKKWRTYLGMQSLLDKHLGRVLDALAENGQDRDTLVVFTSDHGDYMGEHWLWSKGGNHYDGAVRVPFIVRWPGHVPGGGRSAALQCLVDLPATFLAAAGLPVDPTMQGVDQRPAWREPERPVRQGVLVEHRVERGLTVNSWITDRHRLSVHSILAEQRDELELYDFTADPDEFTNLAGRDDCQRLCTGLMAEMLRHRQTISGPWASRLAFA